MWVYNMLKTSEQEQRNKDDWVITTIDSHHEHGTPQKGPPRRADTKMNTSRTAKVVEMPA